MHTKCLFWRTRVCCLSVWLVVFCQWKCSLTLEPHGVYWSNFSYFNIYVQRNFMLYKVPIAVLLSQLTKYCFGAILYGLEICWGDVVTKCHFIFPDSLTSAYSWQLKQLGSPGRTRSDRHVTWTIRRTALRITKHRTITESPNESNNQQRINNNRTTSLRTDSRFSHWGLNVFYWYQIFALDSDVVEAQKRLSWHRSFLTITTYHHRESNQINTLWWNKEKWLTTHR